MGDTMRCAGYFSVADYARNCESHDQSVAGEGLRWDQVFLVPFSGCGDLDRSADGFPLRE